MTRRIGDRLDAKVRYAYAFSAEPEQALLHTMRWLGRGLLLPDLPHSQQADLEHFRRHSPDALASLLDCVGRCIGTTADPARMPAIALAISQARWVKAWAPDILFSLSGSDGCLSAMVVSWLLDIPRVHFHVTPASEDAPDLGLNLEYYERANLVAVPSPQSLTTLTESLARTIGTRLLPPSDTVDWQQLVARDVGRILRQRPHSTTRADLGPRAAWGSPTTTSTDQSPAMPRPFLVLGTARTGSNLLVELLNSHPRLLTAGELFQPDVNADNIAGAGLPEGFAVATYLEMRQHDPGACIRHLRSLGAARGAAAVGCKLFHHHTVADNRLVDSLLGMPDLRLIHLSRLDHVARYLSLQRAELSGTWYTTADQSPTKRSREPIHLDPRLMLHDLELTESLETRIRETFAGFPSLDVSYEDLVADREGQMRRIFDFLGVEHVAPSSQSLKTGESDPRVMIANWEALESMLAGTRWNHQVDRDTTPTAAPAVSRGTNQS